MNEIMKRSLALIMALVMCLSLLPATDSVVNATGFEYVYDSTNTYIYNWGERGETATSLSPNAEAFYTTGYTYEELAAKTGGTGTSDAPNSELYTVLQNLMKAAHSHETTYAETRDLYQYTDCQKNGGKISAFYSGAEVGPAWDGSTWNREHTWPNSKGLAGNDENDIMMLRPAAASVNSSRSNTAYGKSSGYYNPNSASNGELDLRGDVARIFLYVYVRWGAVNGNGQYTTWGTTGVMESLDVLLEWMEADPVDTWELGRNDSVQSITGTRNVFVDYPELAFLLFGAEVPSDMITPSGEAAGRCDHNNFDAGVVTNPTCTAQGFTTYSCQTEGCEYSYKSNFVAMVAHNYVDGACTACGAREPSTMYIYYPAGATYVSATASGSRLAASTDPVAWNVDVDENGYYLFSVNGEYMTSGETGNSLFLSAELTDCGRWEVIECDGGVYLRNVGAAYNGNHNQYLEYYSGFTTYRLAESEIYVFQLKTPCQHANTEALPAQEATCGATGLTAGTKCTDCGMTVVAQEEIPATGEHTYANGVCTGCGAEEPNAPVSTTVTISFADKANRTTFTTAQQVWEQNGITVTNDKATSTSNVGDYYNPARFYKSSNVTIAYPGMTKIEIDCVGLASKYVTPWLNVGDGATATNVDGVIVIEFETPVDSFTYEKLSAQARANSMTVTAAAAEPACEHTNTAPNGDGAVDATCNTEGHTGKIACTDCGEVVSEGEPIPATGEHTYENGACTGCGAEEPNAPVSTTVTISFADEANRTTFTTTKQIWEQNGITVTNDKATSTSNVGDYYNPARFYKNSNVTIAYPGMTKIEIDCVGLASKYVTPWLNVGDGATATNVDGVIVIEFETPVDSFTYEKLSAQARANSMTVTAAAAEPACEHTNTAPNGEGAVDATCNTEGHTGKIACVDCGEVVSEGEVIPAGHNYVDRVCTGCGEYEANATLTIEEAIALGASKTHDTYTEGKYYVTGVITEVYNTTYGNMRIKDEEGNILTIYGTFNADGTVRYDAMETKPLAGDTVTVYGIIGQYSGAPQMKYGWIVAHTPAPCDHVNTELQGAKEATCTENGYTGDTYCTDCETTIGTGNAILAKVHSFEDDVCTGCGKTRAELTLTIEDAIALGASKEHNNYTDGKFFVTGVITEVYQTTYGNMRIKDEEGNILTIYGTYSADGSTRYDAMDVKPVAGDTVTVYGIIGQYNDVPQMKNGWIVVHCTHESTEVVGAVDATCTVGGYTGDTVCADCGKLISKGADTEAPGHTEEILPGKDATCTETGLTEGKKCSACGEILGAQEEVPMDDHKLVQHEGKAATCTENGWEAYETCENCDYTTYVEIAAGHVLVQHESKAATCTENGWEAYETCENCDYTTYVEIAGGHKYAAVVTVPTCIEGGFTTYTCSVCGDHYVSDPVDALGHDMIHHDAQAPTCCYEGWEEYEACSRCGHNNRVEIAATGHEHETVAYLHEGINEVIDFLDFLVEQLNRLEELLNP